MNILSFEIGSLCHHFDLVTRNGDFREPIGLFEFFTQTIACCTATHVSDPSRRGEAVRLVGAFERSFGFRFECAMHGCVEGTDAVAGLLMLHAMRRALDDLVHGRGIEYLTRSFMKVGFKSGTGIAYYSCFPIL